MTAAVMTGAAGIVVAAGRGERLGGPLPKALRPLGGRPLVAYAVAALLSAGVEVAVVTAPPDRRDDFQTALREYGGAARVVPGGQTRHDSVGRALALVPASARWVLVHDAARALAPAELAAAVLDVLRTGAPAVVPVLPVADTIKEVDDLGRVRRTVDRSRLVAAQTPQGFDAEVLRRAHAQAAGPATDDAGLVEALGVEVVTIPGVPEAMKITRPLDLAVAELLVRDVEAVDR